MNEQTAQYVAIGWLALISIVAVVATVADKLRAKRGSWRVPEAALTVISLLGGSVAMLATMLVIRHKTKHPKFMVGIPVIIILQLLAAFALFKITS